MAQKKTKKSTAKKTTKKSPKKRKSAAVKKPATPKRPFDVALFGATGFTGGLVAEYIAEQAEINPKRIALAGRTLSKLEAVRERMAKINPNCKEVGLIEADINQPDTIDALARQSKAVATTVGPYVFYGEPLLAACAKHGTHYADLTGEPEFVDKMRVAWDDIARKSGAKIVNCCGFDSIPHDAGVFYTVNQLRLRHNGKLPSGPLEIRGYVSSRGTFSGGTFHSAVHAFSRGRQYMEWRQAHRNQLKPDTEGRKVRGGSQKIHRVEQLEGWGIPLPTVDPQIVLRTAASNADYGNDFRYGHFAKTQKLSTGLKGITGVGALLVAAQIPPLRKQLLKFRSPGEGPDQATRDKSWFAVDFLVHQPASEPLHTRVSGGDAGYSETAKMLSETVTALALDKKLPDASGVLTPVQAIGERLVERLNDKGIVFEVVA